MAHRKGRPNRIKGSDFSFWGHPVGGSICGRKELGNHTLKTKGSRVVRIQDEAREREDGRAYFGAAAQRWSRRGPSGRSIPQHELKKKNERRLLARLKRHGLLD